MSFLKKRESSGGYLNHASTQFQQQIDALYRQKSAGLMLVERLLTLEPIKQYHLAHAARADLCRRLGRFEDVRDAYLAALGLTQQLPERAFIERRLGELGAR